MTIVASVKVHDGIVLGTDSMTQVFGTDAAGNSGFVKAYDHAQKLFPLGSLPIGVMTYGSGNLGPRSVGSYIAEFSRTKLQSGEVKDVSDTLFQFLRDAHATAFAQLSPEKRPPLGVFIGGYSTNKPLAEEYEFVLPGSDAAKAVRPMAQFGAAWRGIALPFTRAFTGFDQRLHQDLLRLGVKEQDIIVLSQKYSTPIMFDGMPVQEALDFVVFILETTINFAKFEVGVAACGGPLWIAAITAASNSFQWIRAHELRAE